MRARACVTWGLAAAGAWLLDAAPLLAQQARPSAVAIDTAAETDESVDTAGHTATGLTLDAVVSLDVGHGFQGIVRPFVQRLTSGEWNRQVWVAAVRYERAGTVGVRVDAGLIPPPVGLANLTLRPHLIPTIAPPASLFTPLPPIEPGGPRANLLGGLYPYGVHVTLSGRHWDARAAAIDTSPIRPRRIFGRANPPRFANIVAGGGVTPFVGFHVGTSVTHGGWLQAGEPLAGGGTEAANRNATIVTVESDFAFRYTKVSAEWARDALETSAGTRTASGWYVQGQQTITPRWFLGGRVDRMSAEPAASLNAPQLALPGPIPPSVFTGVEETLGYRLTTELTLRIGHRARRGFGRPEYDHQAAVSVVWWRRWK